jgi:hypothetical protein
VWVVVMNAPLFVCVAVRTGQDVCQV